MGYVILRPVMTAVGTVAELAGVYGSGEMRVDRVYPYTTFINGVAQFWALYCLVLMYHVRFNTLPSVLMDSLPTPLRLNDNIAQIGTVLLHCSCVRS